MKKIQWKTEKRLLKDLKEHPSNPRTLSKKSHKDLLNSFKKFDYAEIIAINTDGVILAGHQRAHIMLELGWGDKEIEVRVPNHELSENDAKEYLIRSNKNTGDWDFDILANQFESLDLLAFGFEEKELLGEFEIEDKSEKEVKEIDFESKHCIEISCTDENHQKELYDEFQERGLTCKILTL